MNRDTSSPGVIVAHLGARLHYAVAVLLHRRGYLTQLFTDSYVGPGSWLGFLTPFISNNRIPPALKRLSQRTAVLPKDKITAYNLLGLQYAYELRNTTNPTDVTLKFNQAFCEKVIQSPYLDEASTVYGFTGSSLELLEAAEKRGLTCIVEQMSIPISEFTSLARTEARKWPGWQIAAQNEWPESVWQFREKKEWELADVIVAPSAYIRHMLITVGVTPHKIVTIPYAVSLEKYRGSKRTFIPTRPLRVLFVGRVSLLKGVPYLLDALYEMGPDKVQAKIVGANFLAPEKLTKYRNVAECVGKISRAEVRRYYEWADVFVLPSLCEGSATVTYEARANGLPVIATPNSGAWIEDGFDGFNVPAENSQSLIYMFNELIKKPHLIAEMSANALLKSQFFSWEMYQERLCKLASGEYKQFQENNPFIFTRRDAEQV